MYQISIGSIFKNESHIMEEWLLHYIKRGIDHFYLVNDNSTDEFADIIKKYSEKITLFNNDIQTDARNKQPIIYEKYFRPILSQTKWLAVLDLDEFMYSPTNMNFTDIVQKYDSVADGFQIQWKIFGNNGHITQPKSVVNGFTKREKKYHDKIWYFKSMFKTNKLIKFEVHNSKVKGKILKFYNDDNNNNVNSKPDLTINHYAVQSMNFFFEIKAKRSRLDNYGINSLSEQERVKQFFDNYLLIYNRNNVDDFELVNQNS